MRLGPMTVRSVGAAVLTAAVMVTLLSSAGSSAQAACLTPEQAIGSLGYPACVEGLVTNAFFARQSNGQPTFLDMGPRFTAVIWGDDRAAFNPAPETRRGQRIRVTGVVSEFRGKAQIIVREPAQLGPAGGPPPLLTPARTRTATATPASQSPTATATGNNPATTTIPPPVATAVAVPAATVEAQSAATAAAASEPAVLATPLEPASAAVRPAAEVTAVATAVSRARAELSSARTGGPDWLMVAGGLGLVAAGAGGALALTRRRPRESSSHAREQ